MELTLDQRKELERLVKTGTPKAFTRQRAQIWLRVDREPHGPTDTDRAAAAVWAISHETVVRARQACGKEGMAQALRPKPLDHPRRRCRLDGVSEVELVKLACWPTPPGQARWTLALLVDQLMALQMVDSIAKETVPKTLRN